MDIGQEKQLQRHRWIWNHLAWLVTLLTKFKYGSFVSEPAPELEAPYLVLPNHSCGYDQFFVALSFKKRQMYFVVSEHAFRKKWVSFLMKKLFAPISRIKGSVDASAVLTILRTLKKGSSVCIFPEGNRSWDGRTGPIHPTTAKLLKLANVPVMTYRITGGYLSNPRWAHGVRKGKVHGSVVHIYQPAELKAMSLEAIHTAISADLAVDAYAEQKKNPILFRGKRLAEGLEEALFLCPRCRKIGGLKGKDGIFSCSCGFQTEFDHWGFFTETSPFHDIPAWDEWQKTELMLLAQRGGEYFRDEAAVLDELGDSHKLIRCATGTAVLTASSLTVGSFTLDLGAMQIPALCHFKNTEAMMFNLDGHSYEMRFLHKRGSAVPSIRKYMMMIELLVQNGEQKNA